MGKANKDEAGELQTSWTLVRKLANPACDEESWQRFYLLYKNLLLGVARKAGLTHEEAEDAMQETMRNVSANIKDFKPDPAHGSFKSWLMQNARWRIADQIKRRSKAIQARKVRDDDSQRTATIDRVVDPASVNFDAAWETAWQKELLEVAVERVRVRVSPEQFQVFDLYHLRQMPAAAVARSLGVLTAKVYLTNHRVLKLVQKEVRALEKKLG